VPERVENGKFTVKKVEQKILDLRADGAAGPNSIGPSIKELACGLAPALVEIYRKSMVDGVVPEA
jgi:hypothetical protein